MQDAKLQASFSITHTLKNKTLFVIGGTGFLGKVWLSLLLHRYPEVKHIYLVVRPKAGQDSMLRFLADVLPSPVFDPLRERHGQEDFEKFLLEKITPIPGDLQEVNLGVPEAILEEMKGKVEAVINVSGLVDFNPPLDEALSANAFGIKNLVAFARRLGDLPILHTSTCYVAGNRSGVIEERDPRSFPFPRADELDRSHWAPEREIAECVDLVESARHRCNDAFRQSAFLDEAKQELRKKGEPARGPALEDALSKVKKRFIRKQLSGAGLERAQFWGFPNTYTYTKSIGEQIIVSSGLRVCICRPAVVETSIEYPFAGWNEGINTSTPIIMMSMKGHVQIPTRPGLTLDVIPVDMVASGMIAALAALLDGSSAPVYQLCSGDLNPIEIARMIELVGLSKRRRYRAGRGNPLVDFIQAHIEPVDVNKDQYSRIGASSLSRYAKGVSGLLKKAAVGPLAGTFKGVAKALDGYSSIAALSGDILDVFMPFIYDNMYEFRADNTRALLARMSQEERDKLVWHPEKIDWRNYFLEVHIPGLEKWVEDKMEEKFRREEKPLRRHENLWAMLEEVAERHDYAPALQRLEGEELWKLSYRDLLEQASACATRLVEEGIAPGDRVALSAKNHPAWPVAYFGILRAGATVVPIDPEMEVESLLNVLSASQAKVALFDGHVEKRAGAAIAAKLPKLVQQSLFAMAAPGRIALPEVTIEPDHLASLIFTSGTTGNPKGVMLSHRNFAALLASLTPIFPLTTGDSSLSVLPLHHTFEFSCGLLIPLSRGARITYLDELNGERLVAGLKKGKITALVGVPALWQLLERRITAQVAERGIVAKTAFNTLTSLNRSMGQKLGFDASRLLFGSVHKALGGNLRYLVSGGAALPQETQKLFQGLGLYLAEGYGLTEAAPVLTVAKGSPKEKPGHVGRPLPGVSVKIDSPDSNGIGEVLARGDNVMRGYAGNEEATRAVLTSDGWLRTGDLGRIDHKGRLVLVGRAKEVIVSANGENVYPDDVENLLGNVKYIKELSIVGIPAPRGGELVACIAVPSTEEGVSREDAVGRAEDSLRTAIRALPSSLRPQIVQIYEADLPRTATRKVKRKECQKIIERFMAASEGSGGDSSVSEVKKAIAAVTGVSLEKLSSTSRLSEDLGLDSLARVELVSSLDAKAKQAGLPSLDGEKVMQATTVADVEALFGKSSEPKKRPTIEDDDDDSIQIPGLVSDIAKSWMRKVQLGFYETVMDTTVTGRAFIPQNRHCLVVANHASHLDLGAVKYALGPFGQDVVTVAAKDYFFDRDKVRKTFFESFTNVIPIDRQAGGRQALEGAAEALAQGRTLLLFPEGTRTTTGFMSDFKPGMGYLVLEQKVDVLPVYVDGSYDSMPRGSKLPSKRALAVKIGPVLPYDVLLQKVENLKLDEAARVVTLAAQRAVEALRDGVTFDLAAFEGKLPTKEAQHPMESLFGYLEGRFAPNRADKLVRYYFSLGDDANFKWSVTVDATRCEVKKGKPETAECVVKTSPVMMEKIIRQAYVPDPAEFVGGAIKTSDLDLLQQFVQIFDLSSGGQS